MDKRQTAELKGAAIILMLWHHLFGCIGYLVPESYNWVPVLGPLDGLLGIKGKLCIALFAAASGYGLFHAYIEKQKTGIWRRIAEFLISYWTIMFLVAIPCLLATGRMDWKWLPANLVALYHNDAILYVTFSWYVKVHLEILLVLPLVRKIQPHVKSIWADLGLFVVLPLAVARMLPYAEAGYVSFWKNFLSSVRLLLSWYPAFHMGVIAAKYQLIGRLKRMIGKIPALEKYSLIPGAAGLFGMAFSLWLWNGQNNALCAFLFMMSFALACSYIRWEPIHRILAFLGKYSFQYWMLSGMFFVNTSDFLWVLFLPRYSIVICVWNFLLLTPGAIIMEKLSSRAASLLIPKAGPHPEQH